MGLSTGPKNISLFVSYFITWGLVVANELPTFDSVLIFGPGLLFLLIFITCVCKVLSKVLCFFELSTGLYVCEGGWWVDDASCWKSTYADVPHATPSSPIPLFALVQLLQCCKGWL